MGANDILYIGIKGYGSETFYRPGGTASRTQLDLDVCPVFRVSVTSIRMSSPLLLLLVPSRQLLLSPLLLPLLPFLASQFSCYWSKTGFSPSLSCLCGDSLPFIVSILLNAFRRICIFVLVGISACIAFIWYNWFKYITYYTVMPFHTLQHV